MTCRLPLAAAFAAASVLAAEERAAAPPAPAPTTPPVEASPRPADLRTFGPADPGVRPPDPVPVVIVTADRRAALLDRSTASVTVLDAGQERARGYPLNLHDRLRGVPGVDVQNATGGLDGGVPQVRIRGAATGDTQFLLDGIPFNEAAAAAGNPNPAFLGPGGAERIEVVRGAQSGLYGSRATGGVVNVLSHHATPETHGFARAEGGTYGTARLDAGLTGPLVGGLGYAVGVHGLRSDGFSVATDAAEVGDDAGHEPDGLWRAGGQARLEQRLAGGGSVYGAWYYDRIDQDYDLFAADDAANVNEFRFWRLASGAQVPLGRHLTVAGDVAYSSYDRFDPSLQTGAFGAFTRWFWSGETYADLRATWTGLERVTLTAGADVTRQAAIIEDTDGLRTVDEVDWLGGGWLHAVYADDLVEVSAAARQDLAARSEAAATWRLGAACFLFDDALKPHAAVSTGFRAPSLSERFEDSAFIIGNPDLEPQRSLSVEAGVTLRAPVDAWLDLTAFRTVLDDRIEFVPPPAFGQPGTLANDPGTVEFHGLEVGAHAAWWNRRLIADLAWTWTDSDDAGADVRFTPRHRWLASLGGEWGPVWATATVERATSQIGFDAVTFADTTLPAYTVVGLAAGWQATRHWQVHARVENLLDADYEVNDGFTTPGLSAYGGIEGRF